jgi:NhaA family Na+:H+ antiporter
LATERNETNGNNGGATVSLFMRIAAGREPEFEEYLQGITEAAEEFPGLEDVRAYRPRRGRGQYRVVLRFEGEESLQRWRDSDVRQYWVARVEDLAEGKPRIANITGTAQEQPLSLALSPIEEFVRSSISGIGLLLLGTVLALVAANTRFVDDYERFWTTYIQIGSDDYNITTTLRHWVNDGLMALFFFLLGIEIKREILVGELRHLRQAALPIAAAIGGAIVPAVTYLAFNLGRDGQNGWGVPIGTDTAFALGILSIFGTRVRPTLLVFLTAATIVDDILAVGVIAIFYTDELNWRAGVVAVALLAILGLANRAGFHRWPTYAALGLGVWLAVYQSGVHGTFAGVLLATVIPARSWINPAEFLRRGRAILDEFERWGTRPGSVLSNQHQQHAIERLERVAEEAETPMTHLEHGLSPWVSFVVLPVFAFANAGIPLTSGLGEAFGSAVTWGVIAGLVIGKPLGIALFTWLAVRLGIAYKPKAIGFSQIVGVACLSGIGFTMSLFIAELAFSENGNAHLARVGVLFGSAVAGTIGYLVLNKVLPPPRDDVPEVVPESKLLQAAVEGPLGSPHTGAGFAHNPPSTGA